MTMDKIKKSQSQDFWEAFDMDWFISRFGSDGFTDFVTNRAEEGYSGACITLAECCYGIARLFKERGDKWAAAAKHCRHHESDEFFDNYYGDGSFLIELADQKHIRFIGGPDWRCISPIYKYIYAIAPPASENNVTAQDLLACFSLEAAEDAEALYWWEAAARSGHDSANEELHEYFKDKHFILLFDAGREMH